MTKKQLYFELVIYLNTYIYLIICTINNFQNYNQLLVHLFIILKGIVFGLLIALQFLKLIKIVVLKKENDTEKEKNEFLIKRERKLQNIEMMFKGTIDLEALSELVKEKE